MRPTSFARRARLAVIGAFLASAGCLGPESDVEPTGGVAPSVEKEDGLGVLLSDCRRIFHTMDVPRAVYSHSYPSSLEPVDPHHGYVGLDFLSCRQAVQPGRVDEAFELLVFGDQIESPNESAALAFSWFPLEAFTTSRAFAENASRLGFPVVHAGELAFQTAPSPLGRPFDDYELALTVDGETRYRAQGTLLSEPRRSFQAAEGYYFESEAGLRLLTVSLAGRVDQGGAGTVQFGPHSPWGANAVVDEWEHRSIHQVDVSGELRFGPG